MDSENSTANTLTPTQSTPFLPPVLNVTNSDHVAAAVPVITPFTPPVTTHMAATPMVTNPASDITCVCFLVDESGSMHTIEGSTKTNIQECRQKLSADGECFFSLYTFSSGYPNDPESTLNVRLNYINSTEDLEFEYMPGGMTALYDAQMVGINHLRNRIQDMDVAVRPSKIIFVTITDGEENDSQNYTSAQVRERINYLKDNEDWQFVYIGANQDSFHSAGQLGVNARGTLNYSATDEGISFAMESCSRAISSYRRNMSQEVEFTENTEVDAQDNAQ